MIKDKKEDKKKDPKEEIIVPDSVAENPFVNMYNAIKRAILTVREDEENPSSLPLFKSIMIDTGQFERIIRDRNMEFEIAFPAIFVHFTNVRYLVQQQRIGEGRATMRVRFILNTLNNQDTDRECDPYIVFQRLNIAIQDAKDREPALNERCNLMYFDMPTTCNMLQAYWIDYEVWFRESSAWKYRNWVKRYLVVPPFTNHDDAPEHNENNHSNHKSPTYKEISGFVPSVEDDDGDEGEEGNNSTDTPTDNQTN